MMSDGLGRAVPYDADMDGPFHSERSDSRSRSSKSIANVAETYSMEDENETREEGIVGRKMKVDFYLFLYEHRR